MLACLTSLAAAAAAGAAAAFGFQIAFWHFKIAMNCIAA